MLGLRAASAILFVSAPWTVGVGCGQSSADGSSGGSDGGGAGGIGAGGIGAAGSVNSAARAGAPGETFTLDASECAQRPVSDCQGVAAEYGSNGGAFDATPALAACSKFNSFDGCSSIAFGFDAEGCAVSVVARYERAPEKLVSLRECLTTALRAARWPCLASGGFVYHESCFIK